MRVPYRLMYRIGLTPWERLPALPAAEQISGLLAREEHARGRPYGQALDLGCGSGIWSVALARRGWHVTGVEIVPRAVRAARERAQAAGVEVRFVEGDVTRLQAAGVGSGFRLVLDFGTVHGLARQEREAVGREVTALATPDATLLMYATAPGHRGPLPRGLSPEDIEAAYPAWMTIDENPFDTEGTPGPFKKANPRWYRLIRR